MTDSVRVLKKTLSSKRAGKMLQSLKNNLFTSFSDLDAYGVELCDDGSEASEVSIPDVENNTARDDVETANNTENSAKKARKRKSSMEENNNNSYHSSIATPTPRRLRRRGLTESERRRQLNMSGHDRYAQQQLEGSESVTSERRRKLSGYETRRKSWRSSTHEQTTSDKENSKPKPNMYRLEWEQDWRTDLINKFDHQRNDNNKGLQAVAYKSNNNNIDQIVLQRSIEVRKKNRSRSYHHHHHIKEPNNSRRLLGNRTNDNNRSRNLDKILQRSNEMRLQNMKNHRHHSPCKKRSAHNNNKTAEFSRHPPNEQIPHNMIGNIVIQADRYKNSSPFPDTKVASILTTMKQHHAGQSDGMKHEKEQEKQHKICLKKPRSKIATVKNLDKKDENNNNKNMKEYKASSRHSNRRSSLIQPNNNNNLKDKADEDYVTERWSIYSSNKGADNNDELQKSFENIGTSFTVDGTQQPSLGSVNNNKLRYNKMDDYAKERLLSIYSANKDFDSDELIIDDKSLDDSMDGTSSFAEDTTTTPSLHNDDPESNAKTNVKQQRHSIIVSLNKPAAPRNIHNDEPEEGNFESAKKDSTFSIDNTVASLHRTCSFGANELQDKTEPKNAMNDDNSDDENNQKSFGSIQLTASLCSFDSISFDEGKSPVKAYQLKDESSSDYITKNWSIYSCSSKSLDTEEKNEQQRLENKSFDDSLPASFYSFDDVWYRHNKDDDNLSPRATLSF